MGTMTGIGHQLDHRLGSNNAVIYDRGFFLLIMLRGHDQYSGTPARVHNNKSKNQSSSYEIPTCVSYIANVKDFCVVT
jgi:hypothetical protein